MKRSIGWLLAGVAMIFAGFVAGTHITPIVRDFMAPARVRNGDFRSVTEAVGSDVVLLSTTTCPWCQKARAWLKATGVAYRDCQIDIDPFAKAQLDAIGADTVPQLVVRNTVVSGYDEQAFEKLLSSAREPALQPASAPMMATRCRQPD